jgi:ribosomal protein L37AE/L43A
MISVIHQESCINYLRIVKNTYGLLSKTWLMRKEKQMDHNCPFCGEEMEHWNQGIYECEECEVMIDGEVLEEVE